ncbi:MAG TPA: insulinase family protein, partial [Enteractinococcus sp.]
ESVIGPMAEIESIGLNDLTDWYKTWYAPNNATLVIVGDVNPTDAINEVKKYFADKKPQTLPRRPSVMASPEGGMGRTMLVQTLGMAVQCILSSPVIILAIIALVTNSPVWGIITLMVGVLYGAGMLWAGVKLGAKWYERALPETYQSIVKVAALY